MSTQPARSDRFRSYLVLAATAGTIIFNWLAAIGRVGGVTPKEVSDKYPTVVTPAGYAFTIWSLIYAGLVAFSIYQMLPRNVMRYRGLRSLYIFSCAMNCAWILFWHSEQIVVCFAVIAGLWITLLFINYGVRESGSLGEYWAVRAPFGLYFGWVTAAMLVNFAVMLVYVKVPVSTQTSVILGVILIVLAASLGVAARIKLTDYFFPLAVAWALAAIAVKQGVHTWIVLASAFGVIASLIAAASFVANLPGSEDRGRQVSPNE
jgi:translocator protein